MWATVSAFIQALPAILKLFNSFVDYAKEKEAKGAGRAEAIAEAAAIATQQIDEAAKAIAEAEKAHKQNPGSDDAFDKDFQRP